MSISSPLGRDMRAPDHVTGSAGDTDWRNRAECRWEEPDLFFPPGGSGLYLLQIEEAKQVCARCPVRSQCLDHALANGEEAGVWGGLWEEERRAMRRRSARQNALARRTGAA